MRERQSRTYKLELATGDVRDIHVVGGGAKLLKLLAGEDVNGDQVDLGVTVLASLGGGHVDDLAGTVFDADVAVLAKSRAEEAMFSRVRKPTVTPNLPLHGVGGGGTGISLSLDLEGVIGL